VPTVYVSLVLTLCSSVLRGQVNDDNETVAAMDILVPKIGELIGGSQR
jgi:hypothetical protein